MVIKTENYCCKKMGTRGSLFINRRREIIISIDFIRYLSVGKNVQANNKNFTTLHYWPFVRGMHRSSVDSPRKGSKWSYVALNYTLLLNNAKLLLFLCCKPEQAFEKTLELPVIWDGFPWQMASNAENVSMSWVIITPTFHYWWHRRLSYRQHPVSPVKRKRA